MSKAVKIQPDGSWGRYLLYPAKIGTSCSSHIMIKRAKVFSVGQRIEYASEESVQGMSKGCTPNWQSGVIWSLDGGRIFVNMM